MYIKLLKNFTLFLISTLCLTYIYGCSSPQKAESIDDYLQFLTKVEEDLNISLNNFSADTDFTLKIKSNSGNSFVYSTGNSTELVMYRSASTSKMVTAVIILSAVKDGILSLNSHPQDYISAWPTTGNISNITLKNLLNFTSGLVNEPLSLNLPSSDFETSISNIISLNPTPNTPGSEFYYSSTHLQVAGLMTIKAAGVTTWQEIFNNFKNQTNLFENSYYDLPSTQNPRLAGGMHWNANEYLDFLEALVKKTILNDELISQMTSDQINGAIIGYSPAFAALGEDWHYGYGNWIECHASTNNCTQTTRISSPGAYGAYPFIDYEHKYYGILAREGTLGTFQKGYELVESISTKLEDWALLSN